MGKYGGEARQIGEDILRRTKRVGLVGCMEVTNAGGLEKAKKKGIRLGAVMDLNKYRHTKVYGLDLQSLVLK